MRFKILSVITVLTIALYCFVPFSWPLSEASSSTANTTTSITYVVPHVTIPWYAPLQALPDQTIVICILKHESRSTYSHPNLGDTDPYQFGPMQISSILWNRWSWVAGVGQKTIYWYKGSMALNAVTIPAYKATLYQQAKVFYVIVQYDGYSPWTQFDGC